MPFMRLTPWQTSPPPLLVQLAKKFWSSERSEIVPFLQVPERMPLRAESTRRTRWG